MTIVTVCNISKLTFSTYTLNINFGKSIFPFRWQNRKEIVGIDPREIIPKRRDIRSIRKYRVPYLDRELLEDERNKFKLQPPDKLPPLTPAIVNNIMVSSKPFHPDNSKDESMCNYLV